MCRGRRCDLQLDLLPWICTRLQTLNESKSSVPFELLMDASHGMLEHYKERLARTEIEKRKKKSEEKLSKTNLFLRRLPAGTTDVYLHNLCSGSVNIFILIHPSWSQSPLVIPLIPSHPCHPSHPSSSQTSLVITVGPVILSHPSHPQSSLVILDITIMPVIPSHPSHHYHATHPSHP